MKSFASRNMLFYGLFALLCLHSLKASNLSITDNMIEEGLRNYNHVQEGKLGDLINHLRNDSNEESSLPHVFQLQRLSLIDQESLLYTNTFDGYSGFINLFSWEDNKGDENYKIVSQKIYEQGCDSISHPQHCTNISYSFKTLLGEKIWKYSEGLGYYQEDMPLNKIVHCTLNHMYTHDQYRNKGIATLGVRGLIKFTFKETSADFIVTSVAEDRPYSKRVFQKNNFKEIQIIDLSDKDHYQDIIKYVYGDISKKYSFNLDKLSFLSLDNESYIRPLFYPSCGGNLYLPRLY